MEEIVYRSCKILSSGHDMAIAVLNQSSYDYPQAILINISGGLAKLWGGALARQLRKESWVNKALKEMGYMSRPKSTPRIH